MRTPIPSLALLSGLGIQHFHELGVSCRRGSDVELPRLWHRAAATAPIGPLAGGPPYAMGTALKKKKKKKKRERARRKNDIYQ